MPDGTWGALVDAPTTSPSAAPVPAVQPDAPVPGGDARPVDPAPDGEAASVGTAAAPPFRAPRAVDPATTALVTGTPSRSADDREVVVRSGDSLWSLVEAHLGPGATDHEVATTWPSWWRANRTTIGDDPDRLLPGQRLVVPVP